MSQYPPRGLFIAGTDTGVGKTHVASRIARNLVAAGHRVGVYKPAASGCRREGDSLTSDDAMALWQAAGQPGTLAAVCPQGFAAPLAPPRAARAEGRAVDAGLLRAGLDYWGPRGECPVDIVLVEGCGGLLSPVSDDDYTLDLAVEFDYPLVIVAANALGVINQTLQTLIAASTGADTLEVAGIVLNHPRPDDFESDPSLRTNRADLEARCVPPVLAELAYGAEEFDRPIDWWTISGLKLLNKLA